MIQQLDACQMYADDMILISEMAPGLQQSLYCTKWSLKFNINKTKVIILTKVVT
jgi:hypothetical protein